MRRRRKWVDYLVYACVRGIATVFEMFSIESNRRFMRWWGRVWFHLPARLPDSIKLVRRLREHRIRAEGNIRRSFPEYDEARVSATALASMEHFSMWVVELLRTPKLITHWTWARHVRLGKLDDAIRVLLRRRGCIMLTGHYGSWELLGYTLATLGFDIVAVMRPLDNEYLNRYLLDVREHGGLKLLYKKGATESADEILESGGALCFIADQNAGRKGLFVDFFGRKASTYKSIGLLAMHHNVPILVGCARRISPKFEYEVCVNRIIEPQEWRDRDDALLWITNEYSQAMESFIRVAPEQYLWMHRRWKTRPKSETAETVGVTTAAES